MKLDANTRKIITQDWALAFPDLSMFKPMWLMRRNGPVLSGICLYKLSSGEEYRPTFHVHNLCTPADGITLGINQHLLTRRTLASDSITVRFHQNHVPEAPERMREQLPFPLDVSLRLDSLLDAYGNYVRNNPRDILQYLYEDVVCYLLWCGRNDEAKRAFERLVGMSQVAAKLYTHPATVAASQRLFDEAISRCQAALQDPTILKKTVEQQVIKHKLTRIPDFGITC